MGISNIPQFFKKLKLSKKKKDFKEIFKDQIFKKIGYFELRLWVKMEDVGNMNED